ncbi:MAG: hypothetical protein AAGA60_28270 [Cyanobacteria bacterium P01_E01_bin.42]
MRKSVEIRAPASNFSSANSHRENNLKQIDLGQKKSTKITFCSTQSNSSSPSILSPSVDLERFLWKEFL